MKKTSNTYYKKGKLMDRRQVSLSGAAARTGNYNKE